MNSLNFYKNNIIFYDLLNKYNSFNNNLNNLSQTLVFSLKLVNVNLQLLFSILLALEVYALKKSFFNSNFIVTIKNGNFFHLKLKLRNKNVDFFLLKYIWFMIPNTIKLSDNKKFNYLRSKKYQSLFFFYAFSLKSLEETLSLRTNYKIQLQFFYKLPNLEFTFLLTSLKSNYC